MVAVRDKSQQHMVLSGISWRTFERILDDIGERHLRVAYDNGELEFMTLSFEHESYSRGIYRLIFLAALVLNIPIASGGSTTLKRSLRSKGLEADECFWIQNEAVMRGKKRWHSRHDPPPDLAVEIDITSSWLDRLGIYAAMGVPEIWRFDGKSLKLLILDAAGEYRKKKKSLAFPGLPMDGFSRFVRRLGSKDEIALGQEFTSWLRSEVSK